MSRRLTERIEIATIVNVDDWSPCSLDEFIAELVALRDRQPAEIRPHLMVDAELLSSEDYPSAAVSVVYYKEETDAEYRARRAQEQRERRKEMKMREQTERALFERLKEKYS